MSAKILPFRAVAGRAEEMSDAALLAACGAGDGAALGALFDRHHIALHRFIVRLGGQDSTDDLVQQTFLEVQRSAPKFAARSSVRSWMFGIAANVTRHHFRAESRRRKRTHTLALEPALPSESPAATVDRKHLAARLEAAIKALPRHLREPFVMVRLEGVPGREAAAALGLREGTLWRRLHDARKRLREAVEGRPR